MTETLTPLEPSELAGKTRADLLEMCRARGLKATAWKRDRMFAALTGQDEAMAPAPKKNVLASQLERKRDEAESGDAAVRKAQENMAKRTGKCLSTVCLLQCQAYEKGHKDAFHWQLCSCGHTQWAHAVAEPGAAS